MAARPKIYLLHGWAYQLEAWQPVKANLESAGWRVELLKVPGLTDQTIDQPWAIEDYVNWLSQKLPAGKPVVFDRPLKWRPNLPELLSANRWRPGQTASFDCQRRSPAPPLAPLA